MVHKIKFETITGVVFLNMPYIIQNIPAMKKITILFALVLIAFTGKSQGFFDAGLKAGLNTSKISTNIADYTPQTINNGLHPYGMIYELMKTQYVPIDWVINRVCVPF